MQTPHLKMPFLTSFTNLRLRNGQGLERALSEPPFNEFPGPRMVIKQQNCYDTFVVLVHIAS